ncbi:reverse transcriptase domain-containing protein, partial [Oceanimonas baumannii]
MVDERLWNTQQAGYTHNDSPVYTLAGLVNDATEAIDEHKEYGFVSFDAKKAFDRTPWPVVLHKLEKYGIRGELLNIVRSYLSNRRQRVVINGQQSSIKQLSSGVPQGSVLGPLLYKIYMNDIPRYIQHAKVNMYCDDTTLGKPIGDQSDQDLLQSDIDSLGEWANINGLWFHPGKSKTMRFSTPYRPDLPLQPLTLYGEPIQRVSSLTYLGMVLEENLSWDEHIEEKCSKAYVKINLLKPLKMIFPRKAFDNISRLCILSPFDYGAAIYDDCSQDMAAQIEAVQYEAAKLTSGAMHLTSREDTLLELGWTDMATRRNYFKLSLAHRGRYIF